MKKRGGGGGGLIIYVLMFFCLFVSALSYYSLFKIPFDDWVRLSESNKKEFSKIVKLKRLRKDFIYTAPSTDLEGNLV